jgi:predicted nucleic acid-binding protein
MSRIFFDTMLFIYLLEGSGPDTDRVEYLLAKSRERADELFTSHLVIGEVLAGIKPTGTGMSHLIRDTLQEMAFHVLPFDGGGVDTFSRLRGVNKLKVPDSINLACAAAAKMDLFLTRDDQLVKLHIPGIQFIADFQNPIL